MSNFYGNITFTDAMLQGVPKKGDSCLMTSKDLNILDTDKYSERKIYKLQRCTGCDKN